VVDPDVPIDTEDPVEDVGTVDTSLPCLFTLETVQPGDTVIINCILDLGGATITLPSNVTLVYEGGDIINGTLNFSDNTVISGELLNASLTIGGSTPLLKDTTFNFVPQRWGIVEGVVSEDIALKNKNILRSLIEQTNQLGVTVFQINEMDAYFKVDGMNAFGDFVSGEHGFSIPSNFSLLLSNNTFLRVQPNSLTGYNLIRFTDGVTNSKIIGGNLVGDRDEHDYSSGETHEFGTLIEIKGASDIVVKNVKVSMASGDGLAITGLGHAYDPNSIPSTRILIDSCIFDTNRRNNISITFGNDILIENNQILNAGQPTTNSRGAYPRFGLDIEAVRGANGVEYEQAYNITIRNNIEKNSFEGGLIVHTGDDVTIENNSFETTIAYTVATGIKILNNNITSKNKATNGSAVGIKAGGDGKSKNNIVSGNTIVDFGNAMVVSDENVEVYDNIIKRFIDGITLRTLKNARINNNIFSEPKLSTAVAFKAFDYIDNVDVYGNVFNIGDAKPFDFYGFNMSSEHDNYSYKIRDNTINSTGGSIFEKTRGFVFSGNIYKASVVTFADVTNCEIKSNIMTYTNVNSPQSIITIKNSADIKVDSNTIHTSIDINIREPINVIDSERITISNNSIN